MSGSCRWHLNMHPTFIVFLPCRVFLHCIMDLTFFLHPRLGVLHLREAAAQLSPFSIFFNILYYSTIICAALRHVRCWNVIFQITISTFSESPSCINFSKETKRVVPICYPGYELSGVFWLDSGGNNKGDKKCDQLSECLSYPGFELEGFHCRLNF